MLKPNVHLAAALAAEAGTVARAVAMQAKKHNQAKQESNHSESPSPPRHNGHYYDEPPPIRYHHNEPVYEPSVSLQPSLV